MPLTADYAGTSKKAMWWKGRVYFLTDRDGTMNLWSMDENRQGPAASTRSTKAGIFRTPRNRTAGSSTKLEPTCACSRSRPVRTKPYRSPLASDFDHLRERWIKNPHDYTTSVHLSPDGSSVVLTSRGRAFVAPLKGRLVDVSAHKPGRYRDAWFLPDGKEPPRCFPRKVERWSFGVLPPTVPAPVNGFTNDG